MHDRKRSSIFRRAWDLVAIYTIAPLEKVVRNPISRNSSGGGDGKLLLFKRSRKMSLLRHYNYHFIGEYEFSPSNTPTFHRSRRSPSNKRSRLMCLLLCGGGGGGGAEAIEGGGIGESESETAVSAADTEEVDGELPEESDLSEDDESVDRRAERFISTFYEEMRMQRQDSALKYVGMLNRSC